MKEWESCWARSEVAHVHSNTPRGEQWLMWEHCGGGALHHCTSCNYRLLNAWRRAEGFARKREDGGIVMEWGDISTWVWKPAISVCTNMPVAMTVAVETCFISIEWANKIPLWLMLNKCISSHFLWVIWTWPLLKAAVSISVCTYTLTFLWFPNSKKTLWIFLEMTPQLQPCWCPTEKKTSVPAAVSEAVCGCVCTREG